MISVVYVPILVHSSLDIPPSLEEFPKYLDFARHLKALFKNVCELGCICFSGYPCYMKRFYAIL